MSRIERPLRPASVLSTMMMMMMMGVTKYYSSYSKCSSALDWVGGLQAICINSVAVAKIWVFMFNHPRSANHTALACFD